MSDVAAGGATVFPNIGVKLWPEKVSLFLITLFRPHTVSAMERYCFIVIENCCRV